MVCHRFFIKKFPRKLIEEYKMIYTMRDVNRLRMDRGWPKLMALEYYIELAQESGNEAKQVFDDGLYS